MSREEAATAYLDAMLGFKRDYSLFCRAVETLSEKEKEMLLDAVVGQRLIGKGSVQRGRCFFRRYLKTTFNFK